MKHPLTLTWPSCALNADTKGVFSLSHYIHGDVDALEAMFGRILGLLDIANLSEPRDPDVQARNFLANSEAS